MAREPIIVGSGVPIVIGSVTDPREAEGLTFKEAVERGKELGKTPGGFVPTLTPAKLERMRMGERLRLEELEAERKRRIADEKRRLEEQARQKSREAAERFRQRASLARTRKEREFAAERLQRELGVIRGEYQVGRVAGGVVSGFTVRGVEKGRLAGFKEEVITKQTLAEQKALSEREFKGEIAKFMEEGKKVEFIPGGVRISEAPGRLQKFVGSYLKAEEKVAAKTTKPVFGLLERRGADLTSPEFQKVFFPPSQKIAIFKTPGLAPTERKFFAGFSAGIFKDIKEKPIKQVALVGAGAAIGAAAVGAGSGLAAISPKALRAGEIAATTAGIGLGGLFAFKTGAEIVSAKSAEQAGAITGVAVKDIALIGGGIKVGRKGIEKGIDILRTARLKELPTEKVIAPEFLRGQKFPSVRRGTRVGQLRKEFLEPVLPGEKAGVPRGFTATARQFKKVTTIEPGTSEVPGSFAAPKISPHFLRTGGEPPTKLLGTKGFLGGTTPTTVRLKFKTLGFPERVTAKTIVGTARGTSKMIGRNPLTTFKGFFQKVKGTGRTFVPGAKTEKEAITAADTAIRQTAKRFFFKFGGRRIPIQEFEVIGAKQIPGLSSKSITTLGKAISSSSRVTPSSLVTPLDIGASVISRVKPSRRVSRVVTRSVPSSVSRRISRRGVSRGGFGFGEDIISRASSRGSSGISSGSSSISRSISSSITPTRITETFISPLPLLGKPRKKRKPKRAVEDIAIVQDFTSKIIDATPMKIKRKDFEKLAGEPVGIRRIPIIID